MSTGPWESGDGLEILGSGDVILAKNQPNRLRNKQMGTSAWEPASQHLVAICQPSSCEISVQYSRSKILPKILLKSTAFSQSRNEALNYVENTMYFETSDLKILFLMIRNSEITIKYPYGPLNSRQHQ